MKGAANPHAIRLCRGPSVLLDVGNDNAAGEPVTTKARWVKAAYEGRFKGHWMGEFEFTRKTFEEIVKNLQSHPAFAAGSEQATPEDIDAGKFDVVQFDFHHASEMDPTMGEIAVNGTPAQGWVLDGAVRNGPEGKAELWLYSRFMEPAATYLAEKRYKWVSVSVDFAGRDLVTNEPIGAVLTSVALTNRPFLQELPAIAASAQRVRAGDYFYGVDVSTPEDAFEAIRRCLGMSETSDVTAVAAEIAKLKQWSQPGTTPPAGVEVAKHVASLRSILSLPVLSDEAAVFAEIDKLFARLSGASTTEPAEGATVAASRQEKPMSTQNSTVDEKEVRALQSLRAMLTQSLAPRLKVDAATIADNRIVLAMEQGMNASDDLAGLLEAIDVTGVTAGLAQIKNLQALKAKLDEILPKYEAAQQTIDQYETAETEQDVEMAMASQGWDPKDQSKAALRKLLTKERKANKAEFRAQFGITDEASRQHDAERAHLSQSIATQRKAAPQNGLSGPLANLTLSGGRIVQGASQAAPLAQDNIHSGERVDVSSFPGVNLTQKAEHYVRSLNAKQSYDDVHVTAVALVRGNRVFSRDAA